MTKYDLYGMDYNWMNDIPSPITLLPELSPVHKHEMPKILKDCKFATPMALLHYILHVCHEFAFYYDERDINVSGTATCERKRFIESFLKLDLPHHIYESVAYGLGSNVRFYNLAKLDLRPVLYSLIEQCNITVLTRFIKNVRFKSNRYRIDDICKKKLGAFYLCSWSILSEDELGMDCFIDYGFEKDNLDLFCEFGFDGIFNANLVKRIKADVFNEYLDYQNLVDAFIFREKIDCPESLHFWELYNFAKYDLLSTCNNPRKNISDVMKAINWKNVQFT